MNTADTNPTEFLPIEIRPARADDAPALADFALRMARETEGRELHPPTVRRGVERLIARPEHGFYLVAEETGGSGALAGALLVTHEWSDWLDGLYWWIQSVYVRPERRGRGVFRQLHGEVRARAQASGEVRKLRLYVEKDNFAAQSTYRRLGLFPAGYIVLEEPVGEKTEEPQP